MRVDGYCFVCCLFVCDGWKLRHFQPWEERVGWKGDNDTGERRTIGGVSFLRVLKKL